MSTHELAAIQILIADDHELFRRTLRSFVQSKPNWIICGEAGDGIEAVEKAKQLLPLTFCILLCSMKAVWNLLLRVRARRD